MDDILMNTRIYSTFKAAVHRSTCQQETKAKLIKDFVPTLKKVLNARKTEDSGSKHKIEGELEGYTLVEDDFQGSCKQAFFFSDTESSDVIQDLHFKIKVQND